MIAITHGKGVSSIAKEYGGGQGIINYCSITGLRLRDDNGEEKPEMFLDSYGEHSDKREGFELMGGKYVR